MASTVAVSPDTRTNIERLCAYITSDRDIAEYIGCDASIVSSIRARIPRRTRGRPPRQSEVLATGSRISDATISASDRARSQEARDGSAALLRRQLETGQHELNADEFYAVCAAKGWMEPRKTGGAHG